MKSSFRSGELGQIGRNAPLRLGGIIVTDLLFLPLALLISRFQGAAGLGNFILAITIYHFLGIVGAIGLKQGALRYVAFHRGRDDPGRLRSVIRTSLILGLLVSAVLGAALFLRADLLADRFFRKPELTPVFRILGAGLPLFSLSTVLLAVAQGFKRINLQVLWENILRPAGALLLAVILLARGSGTAALVGAWVGSYLLVVVPGLIWLTRVYPPAEPGARVGGEIKSLLHFSLPLLLVSVMYRLLANMDVMMLGYFSPLAAVGVYGIAARFSLLITVPLQALDVIFAPVIAEISGRREQGKLGELYRTSSRWIIWAAGAAFALLLIAAAPLLELFGRNFRPGETVLIILGAGQLTQVAAGSAGFLLAMTGHPRLTLYNNAGLCLLNFLLNLYLIPRYGIIGAAVATAASWTAINAVQVLEVRLILRIHPFSRGYWTPWLALAFSLAAARLPISLISPGLPLLLSRAISGLIFSLLYAFIYFRSGLQPAELAALKGIARTCRDRFR